MIHSRQYSRILPKPSGFALVYEGKQLDDGRSLGSYGLVSGRSYQMNVVAVKGIDITLKTRYGQALQVGDIPDDATIAKVKEEVADQYGIDIKYQIICNGKNEQNEVKVLDDQQAIQKLSTTILDLVIVENIDIALKEKDKLLDEPYTFIKNAKS